MSIKVIDNYGQLKGEVERLLKEGRAIIKGEFMGLGTTTSKVDGYEIREKMIADTSISSVEVCIRYREMMISEDDSFIEIPREQELRVLSPRGDTLWYRRTIIDVWDGEYPNCVGYDRETGDIYLIYLKDTVMVLKRFTTMTVEELEYMEESLNEKAPYKIKMSYESLVRYIARVEGTKHIREKLYIEFDTGIPMSIEQRV